MIQWVNMAGHRKGTELKIPKEVIDSTPNAYVAAQELEKKLDIFGKDVVEAMTYGTMPELLDMSWDMYSLFKEGKVKDLTGTDKELEEYFKFKNTR